MPKENKYNNVYLARIVSFSKSSLLFDSYEVQMPFETEEFFLVLLINDWAYNLETQERYHVIEMEEDFIPYEELTSLNPNQKYAYELYEFEDIWDSFKSVLNIDMDISKYLDPKIEKTLEHHQEMSQCKIYVIDFNNYHKNKSKRERKD